MGGRGFSLFYYLIILCFAGLTACTGSDPQVDFLRSLTGDSAQGPVLKVNGAAESWGTSATPVLEVSDFSGAAKIEIFTTATCEELSKVNESTLAPTDTLYTLTLPALTAEGSYEYYAKTTSGLPGKTAECSKQKALYHYDLTPPAAPTGLTLLTTTHNTSTPSFRVAGVELGASALLYKDAACTVLMGSAMDASSTDVTVVSSAVAEGSYGFYARAMDAAGNSSPCTATAASYVYDITPPAEPSSVALSSGINTPDSNPLPSVDVGGLGTNDSVKLYSDALCLNEVASAVVTAPSMTLTVSPALSADGAYSFHAKALDAYGNASPCSAAAASYVLDTTAPAAPTSLSLFFPASSPSSVDSPQIRISAVVAGDTISLYMDAACIAPAASTLATGTSVVLTSPALGANGTYTYYAKAADSVGNASPCSSASVDYQFDNIAPTVLSVTSSNANKIYGPGASISVQINFSENVVVTTSGGTPSLMLNTTPAREAVYTSGSGSNVLTFTYVVQPGDNAADLNYTSTSALLLNGGVIGDAAGNALNPGLPAVTASQALGVAKDLIILGSPPSVLMVGAVTLPVSESSGTTTVQLALNYDTFYPITVHIATSGNALYGVDYALSTSSVTIPAGSTSGSFDVTVYNNASVDVPRKIKLAIDSAVGSHLGLISMISQKDIYIIDDETPEVGTSVLAQGGSGSHSCLIKSDNDLKCWGDNKFGQLGDNTQIDKSTPTRVDGTANVYTQSAVGGSHSCAIKTDGTLWCWGFGAKGALGNGSIATKLTPTQVGALNDYTQLTAGLGHTCALRLDGGLWCFGDNLRGELGDGSAATQQNSPVQADPGLFYSQVAAGAHHTCGITTSGNVKCWGDNSYGQIGNGVASGSITLPTLVDSGVSYAQIATGAGHTCGVTTTGALKCWGDNSYGQLGDGTTTARRTPTTILASGVTGVVTGYAHTCALLSTYEVKCWGDNSSGQLGNAALANSLSPLSVFTPDIYTTQVVALAAGAYHTCAAFGVSKQVRCWGSNSNGQLGTGTDHRVKLPALVEKNMSTMAVGLYHACAITGAGAVRCWGNNAYGQIGDGTQFNRNAPVEVIPSGAVKIAAGDYFTCAVLDTGKLLCWGYNGNYRLGDGTLAATRLRPVAILASNVADVALGTDHGCALMTTGAVQCWGNNSSFGKVGTGTTTPEPSPVQVISSGATQISLGDTHSCALLGTQLYCWGDNSSGQYGNLGITASKVPVNTSILMDFISLGASYTCGIQSGSLFCWGLNSTSQLGDGTTITRSVPTQIDLGVSYSKVSARANHTCGVTSAGALKCWGQNSQFQIAETGSSFTTPTLVSSSGVTAAFVGSFQSCWTLANQDLKCVGYNGNAQLGLGDLSNLFQPLHVFGL